MNSLQLCISFNHKVRNEYLLQYTCLYVVVSRDNFISILILKCTYVSSDDSRCVNEPFSGICTI